MPGSTTSLKSTIDGHPYTSAPENCGGQNHVATSILSDGNPLYGGPISEKERSAFSGAVLIRDHDAEGLVADLTFINDNVTYELGYAIGAGKDIRLIRNASIGLDNLKQIGLFDTLLRDEFKTRQDLERILRGRAAPRNKWISGPTNDRQPIYVLSPPAPTEFNTRLFSAIKKRCRFKFRSFKPWEMGRLTAQEAWDQIAASFGVVVTWAEGTHLEARRNNQRAAFLYGIARGLDRPTLLLAHERSELPADLQDQATRFLKVTELDPIFTRFRDEVQDALNEREEAPPLPLALLDSIRCGDPVAESEQEDLRDYFLETEEFKRTLDSDGNIVIGRKGSGKTAIFLQVRDRIRSDKRNIVIDLNPGGYQLLKLKEIMVELQSQGLRKEFIAAFWQYVLWLEIAYKILEKDERAADRDHALAVRYEKLKSAFTTRADTGIGDFSERLRILVDMIGERFADGGTSSKTVPSSSLLQIVYGTQITDIRTQVLSYLKLKGEILFLFDNLDRMRSPSGIDDADGVLLIGLIESMQDISKQFRRAKFAFRWALFIRSDVYEFVVRGMADYGKHTPLALEMGRQRALKAYPQAAPGGVNSSARTTWDAVWPTISVTTVRGEDTLDFLACASLMRPRYMIRLFETARRRAINMGHQRILEDDYLAGLEDLAWTATEDLELELRDIVQHTERLLFDIAQLSGACGLPELREAIANRVGATDIVERVTDVLLWSGSIGIATGKSPTFIYDCGYKLQALRSLMDRNPDAEVCMHPTLSGLFVGSGEKHADSA
jgi:hypothetical protein